MTRKKAIFILDFRVQILDLMYRFALPASLRFFLWMKIN